MSEINDTEELPEGNFHINLKLIDQHKRKESSLMTKYKEGTYHKGSICGGINIYLILIMCEYNIVILSILKSYLLHWYHTYLLHTGINSAKHQPPRERAI